MKAFLNKFHTLFVFCYFCAATAFMTYPVAFQLKDSVIGRMGDNIYFVWLVRWYQKAFLEGGGHPFFNPLMNYPQGWNLSTTDTALASVLPGVPFSYFFGPIAGYNIAMLITFVLSGFFMYLWVRSLTHSRLAGILAGTLFAFSPYRMAHFLAGHLNLSGTEWFPLFFWGLTMLLRPEKKIHWGYVVLTALSLGAIAFTSMYYLYMTLLMAGIFVLVYMLFTRFKALSQKVFWFQVLLAGILVLPFFFVALRPYFTLSGAGGIASRSVDYANMYSASPTDFFLPSSDHFLFGAWVSQHFDRSLWIEGSFYLGLVGLVLSLIALIKNKKSEPRWVIWSAFVVICVSFILALGINLHWNNQQVIWQVPAFLQSIVGKAETPIHLPAYWLFTRLPFFDKMRAIMRFGVFVVIFVPVLAGIGLTEISKHLTPIKQSLLTILLVAVVLFEFYPGSYEAQMIQPKPREVDLWLSQQPGDGAVVEMPFSRSSDQAQLYYTLFYNKPFTGGFFNANQPEQYLTSQPILEKFPDADSIAWLKSLKVEYIVIHAKSYKDFPQMQKQMEALGLVELTEQEGEFVYAFAAQ